MAFEREMHLSQAGRLWQDGAKEEEKDFLHN
mgnify:FL=1